MKACRKRSAQQLRHEALERRPRDLAIEEPLQPVCNLAGPSPRSIALAIRMAQPRLNSQRLAGSA